MWWFEFGWFGWTYQLRWYQLPRGGTPLTVYLFRYFPKEQQPKKKHSQRYECVCNRMKPNVGMDMYVGRQGTIWGKSQSWGHADRRYTRSLGISAFSPTPPQPFANITLLPINQRQTNMLALIQSLLLYFFCFLLGRSKSTSVQIFLLPRRFCS